MSLSDIEKKLIKGIYNDNAYLKVITDASSENLVSYIVNTISPLYPKKPVVIAFTAGPASGKTTIMKNLLKALEKAGHPSDVIVTEDYNFTDREERDERIRSGESPLHLKKFNLLNSDIEKIRSGQEVHLPLYDAISGSGIDRRIFPHVIKQPLHFLFIEGDFQPVKNPDFRIYYFVDSKVRKQNRMNRDVEERGAVDKESVAKSFDEREKQFLDYTLPHLAEADMSIVTSVKEFSKTTHLPFTYKHTVFLKKYVS